MVVGASVVVGVSLVVSEVVDDVSVDVELMVIVVIDVPDEGDGHERSGKSSCRFIFAGAPQPSRELPGCLFPANVLVVELKRTRHEPSNIRVSDAEGVTYKRRQWILAPEQHIQDSAE